MQVIFIDSMIGLTNGVAHKGHSLPCNSFRMVPLQVSDSYNDSIFSLK